MRGRPSSSGVGVRLGAVPWPPMPGDLRPRPRAVAAAVLAALAAAPLAAAVTAATATADGTDKSDWPPMTGVLLMNKNDSSRPLDARPGNDPFGGKDPRYSCDTRNKRGACQKRFVDNPDGDGRVMTSRAGHNKLLGGHGSDTIHAGPWGDVIWGDYKPSGQPTSQRDRLHGGAGNDFIYGSHGFNRIEAGGGDDYVKLHFGHGIVDCGGGRDVLYISRRSKKRTTITGCETVSHKTTGY